MPVELATEMVRYGPKAPRSNFGPLLISHYPIVVSLVDIYTFASSHV